MKILNLVSYLTLLFAFIILATIIVWEIYPYNPVEYKNIPFPILNENKTVKKGDHVFYEIDACKYTDQVPELVKFFVDGVAFETPKTVGVVMEGCRKVVADVYVPHTMPTGEFHLRLVVTYKPNPIRTIVFDNYSENFTIVD